MTSWNRKHDWNTRNIRNRRRVMLNAPSPDDRPHWPDCRTNCQSPRFGRSDTCMDGHTSHECTCEDIAIAAARRLAEAGDDL